jgi:hypothetical protein
MKMSVKVAISSALLVSLSLCAGGVQASRDAVHYVPIQEAIDLGIRDGKLDNDVKFYFGNQPHPPVTSMLTRGISTHQKTNNRRGCTWAMVSALIRLQDAARARGGNAVINIESYYDRRPYRNNSQFECHVGRMMSAVALRGDIVRLGHAPRRHGR